MTSSPSYEKQGFTLIELSIVLVIIGLITGGILVGQDLIHAATLRASVSQIEKYNSAVNTFRGKYGYLPGDIPGAVASQFSFFSADPGFAGQVGYGDGNGLIEPGGGEDGTGEELMFWRHLTDAQLIDGNYGAALPSNTQLPDTEGFAIDAVLPASKLGRPLFILPFRGRSGGSQGFNYFQLALVSDIDAPDGIGIDGASGGISMIDAQAIDAKLDDGKPNSGNVTASGPLNTAPDQPATWQASSTPGNCMSGGASSTSGAAIYNTLLNNPGDIACALKIRFN